jgi:hypothetical protein
MSTNVVLNADLTKAIQDSLNPADIRTVVQTELEKQIAAAGVADQTAQAEAARVAAETVTTEPAGFSRTETIGGREFTFEATSEIELERTINNAYKVAYAVQQTESVTPIVTIDPAVAAAEAETQALAKADLELKFKRGDISAADYIEQSGAVKDYLERQGVPVEALKATLEKSQLDQETQSWADATQVFLHGPAGSDWPGGDKNLELIGLKLQSLGLVDAHDKVAALAQAYNSLKSTGMIFPTEVTTTAQPAAPAIVTATATPVPALPTVPATVALTPRTSSSIFGASSGVGAGSGVVAPAAAGKVDVDPNASPMEIIEAWKKEQVRLGQDPNTAFTNTFARKA